MIHNGHLPTLDGLRRLLAGWRGASAYILEYVGPRERPLGNNGDELLGRVFLAVLRDLGISVVPNIAQADLLLVRPGGALLDRYQAPRLLTRRLAEVSDLPVVIFPSSSWFETEDPARMFSGRSAPTLWISREPRSHHHLRTMWGSSLAAANVSLELDHDVVASGHVHVGDALGLVEQPKDHGDLLVVARLGVEAGRMDTPLAPGPWHRRLAIDVFKRLPRRQQVPVRRRVTRGSQRAATARMLARVSTVVPPATLDAPLSPWCFDISDPTLATYEQYVRAIARASIVITDRLHVAVPAAVLRKPTYLVESGYHKVAGVFEYSLAGLDNLTFVRRA